MPSKNRIDWSAIRAEYIAGGISQRKIAEKYGVKYRTLRDKAVFERWTAAREEARQKAVQKTVQKTAASAADNAATAQRIKAKLLALLERKTDELIERTIEGTAIKKSQTSHVYGENGKLVKTTDVQTEQKIRDLTAAYKDLTADILPEQGKSNELLQALLDLEKRGASDGD